MRKKRCVLILVCVVAAILLALVLWPRPKPLYRVTMLPSLGGRFTLPWAINDRGQVAGYSQVSRGDYHLFLWDRAKGMQDLGPVCNDRLDLNNAGQITGTTADPNGTTQAFLWDPNGGLRLLGTMGGVASRGLAINNLGQIVGSFEVSAGVDHAFLWDATGGMRDLGPGRAWAINDAGEVVVLGSGGRALVQVNEGATTGRLPIPVSGLLTINNGGWVAGLMRASTSKFDVVLWHPGSASKKLIQTEEAGNGQINDANQVLVTEERLTRFTLLGRRGTLMHSKCYLWDPARGLIPLNRYVPVGLRVHLWATDLNNQGCIVGAVQSETGPESQGVLLEPIPERWGK